MENSLNNQNQKTNGEKAIMLLGYAIVLAVALISYYLGYSVFNKAEAPTTNKPDAVITPDKEAPSSISSESNSIVSRSSVELLENPYIPPLQPFDTAQYDETAPRMVLSGAFLRIDLYVHGTVIGEGSRFLILNVDGESGIINASRKSTTQLNIKKTTASGGFFTKDNAISVIINLMDTTLGTIGTEFATTRMEAKTFNFINPLFEKVEVKPIVVVPVKENGQFGGAEIDSIRIKYECQKGEKCSINPCPVDRIYTQCINDVFGEDAMNEWLCRKYRKNCNK